MPDDTPSTAAIARVLREIATVITTHLPEPDAPPKPPPLKPGSRARLPRLFSLGSEKDVARFWAKVKKAGDDECWLWQAARQAGRYGVFSLEGGTVMPHRYAWQLANGPLPPGMHVLHSCDVKLCCNPRHLRLGTSIENAHDRVLRKRQPRGETHPLSRLNEDDVRAIRASHETYAALSKRYSVSPGTIGAIRQRKCWKHLKDDGPSF